MTARTPDKLPVDDDNGHGIVVMAYGSRRYQRQACNLALSLRRHSPAIPRTLVTDTVDSHVAALYDTIVPIDGIAGTDCRQKLQLDMYSPYERTLYLDADNLAVRDVQFIFDTFESEDFAVIGRNVVYGHWYGDVEEMRSMAASPSLPKFNSGLLYFRRGALSSRVFKFARELAAEYVRLGFDRFRGGIADEPLLAIALAREDVCAKDLTQEMMASLLSVTTPVQLDALSGIAAFHKNGKPVAPALVHFAADFSSPVRLVGGFYHREALKLRLVTRRGWPPMAARLAAGTFHGARSGMTNAVLRWRGRAPGVAST